MTGVLQGIGVLDFGRYIADRVLRGLARRAVREVIRIEKRGEVSEDRVQAPITQGGDGGLFMQMNRIKLGITLDHIKAESGGLKCGGAGSCRCAR